MPKRQTFYVDLKTFLSFHVEADTAEDAEAEARAFLSSLELGSDALLTEFQKLPNERGTSAFIKSVGSFDDEESAYIEDENGDEVDD